MATRLTLDQKSSGSSPDRATKITAHAVFLLRWKGEKLTTEGRKSRLFREKTGSPACPVKLKRNGDRATKITAHAVFFVMRSYGLAVKTLRHKIIVID